MKNKVIKALVFIFFGVILCVIAPVNISYAQNAVVIPLGGGGDTTPSEVAFASGGSVNDWDGAARDISVEFNASKNGFLIITHTVNAGRDHSASPSTGDATRGRAQVLHNGSISDSQEASWANEIVGDRANVSWSNNIVVPVDKGINIIIGRARADNISYLYGQDLTVLFVAYGQ